MTNFYLTMLITLTTISARVNGYIDEEDLFDHERHREKHYVHTSPANYSNYDMVMNHEQKLHKVLLKRYEEAGKDARPVKSHSDAIDVYFGMRLIQVDLDEKMQTMTTSAWLRIKWKDAILTWDPEEYGGIEDTRLPYDKIWLPDIGHVNSRHADEHYNLVDIRVDNKGWTFWYIQADFHSACVIDLTEYPFDKHTCDLWFISQSNKFDELKLKPYSKSPLDLATYLQAFKDSQEWQIVGNKSEAFSGSYKADVMLKYSRRPALRFSLTLQRKASFYAFLLLVPSMCLGALTVMVYAIPPDRPDRTGLAMSLFSSVLLMLLLVVGISPPTANAVPKIAHYYALNLALIIASLLTSAAVATVMKRGTYSIPFPQNLQLVCKLASKPLFLQEEALRVFGEPKSMEIPINGAEHKPTDEQLQRRLLFKAAMSWRFLSRILDRFCMVIHAIFILICYIILFPGRSP